MEETPPKKDWFLYLTMPDHICRLNIDEFCKRNSGNPLLFECLYDDASHPDGDDYYHPSKIPTGQHIKIPLDGRHTLVGSKLYIEGSDHSSPDCDLVTYCFDPTDPEGPSLRQCECFIPEDKFYVLGEADGYGYPSLTVFGEDQSWKALPHDVHAVVEFKGFLIAVPQIGKRLVAYRWDSNGVPKLYRVLHELDVIFCPFLLASNFAMGKCDGGRMWLVYVGKDLMDCRYTRVAVFRVSISNDPAGNPVLSADLEAAEFYYFHNCSASSINLSFALCHQPNGDDKKTSVEQLLIIHDAKARFSTIFNFFFLYIFMFFSVQDLISMEFYKSLVHVSQEAI